MSSKNPVVSKNRRSNYPNWTVVNISKRKKQFDRFNEKDY